MILQKLKFLYIFARYIRFWQFSILGRTYLLFESFAMLARNPLRGTGSVSWQGLIRTIGELEEAHLFQRKRFRRRPCVVRRVFQVFPRPRGRTSERRPRTLRKRAPSRTRPGHSGPAGKRPPTQGGRRRILHKERLTNERIQSRNTSQIDRNSKSDLKDLKFQK